MRLPRAGISPFISVIIRQIRVTRVPLICAIAIWNHYKVKI